jgi:D-threonate/D-erythronate kinase
MSSKEKAESSYNSPLGAGGIAVIADDFTGAAELAGISLRFGLTVELCVGEVKYRNADVLVVSTDSRSLTKEAALKKTKHVIKDVLELQPLFIYKKIDSVLRGYVADELKLQMQLMDKQRAIVMPANPTLDRTIKNGEYFINGIKINKTGFANDPEFPVNSSLVKEILNNEVDVVNVKAALPEQGIVAGEADNPEDYNEWVEKLDGSWVLVGAGDFYNALLQKKYTVKDKEVCHLQSPLLYICGTAFEERKQFIKSLDCVAYLPEAITEEWLQQTGAVIHQKNKLVVAIDESNESASVLRKKMAIAVKEIVAREHVKEIFIEGGSTAAAVLEELNIIKLIPLNELSRGVVRMGSGDLFITVKPGSYELPEEIKKTLTDDTNEHR